MFSSCKKEVDLAVYNANIYTVDNNFSVASAFVVNDGKFYDLGNDEIIKKYKPKKLIDLEGSTILPGLIDAHCHFYGLGTNQQVIDLVGTKSLDEIIEKLNSTNIENNSIIRGRGWDQNDWIKKEFPDKTKLDQLFPNTPVVLERIDGHAYLVNQKALDLAKIDKYTSSSNGSILKKNGKLTGVLIDGPMRLIDNVIPDLSNGEKIKALLDAQKICFKNGLTTVDDAGISKEIILLIDSLQQTKDLKIRIYVFCKPSDFSFMSFIKSLGRNRYLRLNQLLQYEEHYFEFPNEPQSVPRKL